MTKKNRMINNDQENLLKKIAPGKKPGLSVGKVDEYLRFMIFLALIGLAYIWNSHQAEKQVKLLEAYQKDVKSLKANYLLKESTLSASTRLSEIIDLVDTLGLKKLKEPAFKIVRNGEIVKESPIELETNDELKAKDSVPGTPQEGIQASRQ